MRLSILIISSIVFVVFIYSNTSLAACGGGPTVFTCDTTPPNPDPMGIQQQANGSNLTVNVLPGAAVDTSANAGPAIITGPGNDQLMFDNSEVSADGDCINSWFGNDVIDVTNSNFSSIDNECIDTATGNDTLNVIGSRVEAKNLDGGSNNDAINTASGDDIVTLETSTLIITNPQPPSSDALDLGSGNDTVNIGNAVELINGGINCGPDFDTIIFTMQVPTNQLSEITAAIESSNPAAGSIVINRLLYQWEDCEELVAQLEPGFVSPVPTLSEWGLIATAGLLGIIGFLVIRRRQLTTNS